jgi:hypothetical protein
MVLRQVNGRREFTNSVTPPRDIARARGLRWASAACAAVPRLAAYQAARHRYRASARKSAYPRRAFRRARRRISSLPLQAENRLARREKCRLASFAIGRGTRALDLMTGDFLRRRWL